MFRPPNLIFASKIVLTTQLLTNYSVIKAKRSSIQCKCRLRGLLQLTLGALLYNRGHGCASGTLKPLPVAYQNFGKILEPLQTKWRKIFENMYPKTPENEFLAVYLCIIEKSP